MFSWPTLELSFLNLPLSRFVHAPDRALTPRRGRGHPGAPGETEAARPAPREPRSCGRSRARLGRARWALALPPVRRQYPPLANAHGRIAGFPAHERIAYHKIAEANRGPPPPPPPPPGGGESPPPPPQGGAGRGARRARRG